MVLEVLGGFAMLAVALFIPGYFLTLAFFTKRGEIDLVERVTFSFVLSITFLPLLVLIENQILGIPIDFYSVAGTFLLIIIAGLFSYMARIGAMPLPTALHSIFPQVAREEAVPIVPGLK